MTIDHDRMLQIALDEARIGYRAGGIPIGSALFGSSGELLGRGHNQRVQRDDPSAHAEVDAFRNAGRRRSYRDTIMVTTLAPCWYCSGLVRQFAIPRVVVGESRTFQGGIDWLRESGVEVIDLDSDECAELLQRFISEHPDVWEEDIGEYNAQRSNRPGRLERRGFHGLRDFSPLGGCARRGHEGPSGRADRPHARSATARRRRSRP